MENMNNNEFNNKSDNNEFSYQGPQYTEFDNNYNEYNAKPSSGLAIASMVLGICSLIFCFCYGFVGAILGIIGISLASASKKQNGRFSGMALTGLICSIVGTITGLAYFCYVLYCIFIIRTIAYSLLGIFF